MYLKCRFVAAVERLVYTAGDLMLHDYSDY